MGVAVMRGLVRSNRRVVERVVFMFARPMVMDVCCVLVEYSLRSNFNGKIVRLIPDQLVEKNKQRLNTVQDKRNS